MGMQFKKSIRRIRRKLFKKHNKRTNKLTTTNDNHKRRKRTRKMKQMGGSEPKQESESETAGMSEEEGNKYATMTDVQEGTHELPNDFDERPREESTITQSGTHGTLKGDTMPNKDRIAWTYEQNKKGGPALPPVSIIGGLFGMIAVGTGVYFLTQSVGKHN